MKTILVISDNTPAAEHAARFALLIARAVQANILIANICAEKDHPDHKVLAGNISDKYLITEPVNAVMERLKTVNNATDGFMPFFNEINISDHDELRLTEFINQDHIWMIVKGMRAVQQETKPGLKLNSILNRVQCPLLLVPELWIIKSLERFVYLADMRYCRTKIVRFLAELAKEFNADLSVAHFSAKGLPNLGEEYALSIFNNEVSAHVNYDRLYFNNIKEKDLNTTLDVLINGLHNDLLTIVNHRFHFEEILGRYITDSLPFTITVPLLIFPY
jgi:hypothetical protein